MKHASEHAIRRDSLIVHIDKRQPIFFGETRKEITHDSPSRIVRAASSGVSRNNFVPAAVAIDPA